MQMNRLIISFVMILSANNCYCYELSTHTRLAQHGFDFSNLGNGQSLLNLLGHSEVSRKNPFGGIYY